MNHSTVFITGGHVTPAIALIEHIQKKHTWNVIFLGRKKAMEGDNAVSYEYKEISSRGIPFESIIAGRLQRILTPYTLISFLKMPVGFVQSIMLFLKYRPVGVVSFGGYLAVPVALAARLFRVPVVTHEQTTKPGLANRIIAAMAEKVCVSWPGTETFFGEKAVLTGNPIRNVFFSPPQKAVVSTVHPIIFITGGSLGSHKINNAVKDIVGELVKNFTVVHQCGDSDLTNDYDQLQALKKTLPNELSDRYIVQPHFQASDSAWLYMHATVVVSRSGANTVSELAYVGTPCILVPLKIAGSNEQYHNAMLLKNAGIAEIMMEDELSGTALFKLITNMVQHIHAYSKSQSISKGLIFPDAVERLSKVVDDTFAAPNRRA